MSDTTPTEEPQDGVLEWLVQLEVEDKLEPEVMVTQAADPDHPAHDQFDWDDSSAAHKYRLGQARALVRRYTVIKGEGDDVVRYRQFTHIKSVGRYHDTERALRDWRDEVLEKARRDMATFTLKYKSLGKATLLDLANEALGEPDAN